MAITISGDSPNFTSVAATTITNVTNISSNAANTPVILGDSGTNYNTCRAWVNFNGTGTVAIRTSFNVTSITDNGTGDYTVNFTTAMVDINYTTVAQTSSDNGTALLLNINSNSSNNTTPTTTATRMYINKRSDGVANDSPYVNVSIFR